MKYLIVTLLAALAITSMPASAEWVNGYYRSNGTYVQGYNRSSPNSTVTDNYSFYGNTNPYTGSTGTNKYYNSPSSPYYNGGTTNGGINNNWYENNRIGR